MLLSIGKVLSLWPSGGLVFEKVKHGSPRDLVHDSAELANVAVDREAVVVGSLHIGIEGHDI